nr:AmmeMemoRadiSam system radical SAM enzyme [Pseudoclavibacter sp. Marseille-Q3772]
MGGQVAKWWHATDDGRIQCDVCPRECRLRDGQRGFCFVRMREGDSLYLDTYGRSSGFVIDPIEKKPLNHFYPGTSVLSFGTAGCNLSCKFCQNWDISTSRKYDTLADAASPGAIAASAAAQGAESIAFTYNDPTIFAEYAIDCAIAARETGVHPVAVSAGWINPEPRRALYSQMDAANIDLKGFTDEFYRRVTGAALTDVLDTIADVYHNTECWVELTTLLIPGKNDSDQEIRSMSEWIVRELGPSVPHHFSAFHPDHKMRDIPRTPAATLSRARRIAMDAGERYVYTGNVHDTVGGTTYCHHCGASLVVRDWFNVLEYRLDERGGCRNCGAILPGRFAEHPGGSSIKRRRIRIEPA